MVVDPASTAFITICMALVQLMTPGLAFFYGGLVNENSVLTMMGQCMVPMGLISIMWYVVLFSLCFGESLVFFGNPATYFFTMNVNTNEALVREGEIFIDGIPGIDQQVYKYLFQPVGIRHYQGKGFFEIPYDLDAPYFQLLA